MVLKLRNPVVCAKPLRQFYKLLAPLFIRILCIEDLVCLFHLAYCTVICYAKLFRQYRVSYWHQVSAVLDRFVAYGCDCI